MTCRCPRAFRYERNSQNINQAEFGKTNISSLPIKPSGNLHMGFSTTRPANLMGNNHICGREFRTLVIRYGYVFPKFDKLTARWNSQ